MLLLRTELELTITRSYFLSGPLPEFQSRTIKLSSADHHVSSVIHDNINLDDEYEEWKEGIRQFQDGLYLNDKRDIHVDPGILTQ